MTDTRTRIGFVCASLHDHVVGRLFRSWPLQLDRSRFAIVVFAIGDVEDRYTAQVREAVDGYVAGTRPAEEWIAQLAGANLDALIYLDYGLSPLSQVLAAFRFARFQAVAWGHPVTSGQASIDAFLSSQWMEPADGERHYSERLIRLPGMGTWLDLPPVPPQAWQEPAGPLRLLCAQAAFKLTPRHDHLFARIAAQLPQAMVMLIPSRSRTVTAELEARMRRSFAEHGADDGRLQFLDYLPEADFEALLDTVHLALDTLDWSGGGTSMALMRHGIPIVTLPRGALRGHQTAGMLRAIGVEETICCNEDEYVHIALRLAREAAFRQRVREAMLRGWPSLSRENESFLAALSELLDHACRRG